MTTKYQDTLIDMDVIELDIVPSNKTHKHNDLSNSDLGDIQPKETILPKETRLPKETILPKETRLSKETRLPMNIQMQLPHGKNFLVKNIVDDTYGTFNYNDKTHANGWTTRNVATLTKWQDEISDSSYVYQIVIDRYKTTLLHISIAALMCTSISAFITLGRYGVSLSNQHITNIILNTLVAMFSIAATILLEIYRLLNFENESDKMLTHVVLLDQFYGKLRSQLLLHSSLRENAGDLLTREAETYATLMNGPNILISHYKTALDTMKNNKLKNVYSCYKYKYNKEESLQNIHTTDE